MRIRSFVVLPHIPEPLEPLRELAYNVYFSWHADVHQLFRKLDPDLWDLAHSNPVRMLSLIQQERLDELAGDKHFLAELESVYTRFSTYLGSKTWYQNLFGRHEKPVYAYFCAEFGLHESLPNYSGGLGVLAGDHIKTASDLGIPLVGVGLLYRQGYFHQYLNAEGMQQEAYPENDYYTMPVELVTDEHGQPVTVSVPMGEDMVKIHVWRVQVGRVSIYLCDTNLPENTALHRDITRVLYDPDRDMRIRQEVILGIGGARVLEALGLRPRVYHVNEGHSAFLAIERIRQLIAEHGLTLEEAHEVIWATTVFTTHTPVPAGNERFTLELMLKYIKDYSEDCGIPFKRLWALGQENPNIENGSFSMTAFALNHSAHCNGVSKLHGEVSREMWQTLYPVIPKDEIPIKHVTNGVHAPSWLNSHLRTLFSRYATEGEIQDVSGATWDFVQRLPDEELWELHEFLRRRLVNFVRRRIQKQMERREAGAEEIAQLNQLLSPKALTLGFARRFATYKRGFLLFSQAERLAAMLSSPDRPVQIVIAGKAHPADQAGKDVIKRIHQLANQPEFRNHIVFIEDYDIEVARYLVQGVDVWVNNPRRPLEASGTSGMKAALNGALNLSILDGWWDEAFHPGVGWPIGHRETYLDHQVQDQIEGDLLYGTLERKIVPLFYDRNEADVPSEWLTMMKASMAELGGQFNSGRMLREYVENMYVPALEVGDRLTADGCAKAKALSAWRSKVDAAWASVAVAYVEETNGDAILKGSELHIKSWLKLGDLEPADVRVECVHGSLDSKNEFVSSTLSPMQVEKREGDSHLFTTTIRCREGGHYGYTVRVVPDHPDLAHEIVSGMMTWSQ